MITEFFQGIDLNDISRLAIESSHNHTILTDVNGYIIYANKMAEQCTGYTLNEMKGKTPRLWGKQMSPDFYTNLWRIIKQEKKAFKGEIINRRKNGEQYTSIATISPIIDKRGILRGFLGVEEDITALKQYESTLIHKTQTLDQALSHLKEQNILLDNGRRAILNILEDEKELESALKREKEGVEKKVIERTRELSSEKARLTAAISSLPHAFLIINSSYQLVLSNNQLTPILGESEGEWTFQKVCNCFTGKFDLRDYVAEIIAKKKHIKKKEIIIGSKYLKIYGAPITSIDTGTVDVTLGVVVTIFDVTEERLLTRSKDEFFSIASHELRTPLTAIRGNTSMILDYYGDKLDQKVKDMLIDTHAASVRLITIVNDFLNVSRLEQGKMEYVSERVSLQDITNKICDDLTFTAREKGNEIRNMIDNSCYVWADAGKVEQILLNLIGNSLKFTEKGKITLSARLEGDSIAITITDTGIGIPLVNQGLLFRKFQQAGSSIVTRDSSQSTGLGLYISRLMAEGMGGTLVLVQSDDGKGAVFCLTLPQAHNDTK